jgi:hypothetical protein
MTLTFKVKNGMMLIARRSFFFTALQFVVITSYYVSLRLAKKKQQRTLNTIQLKILGYIIEPSTRYAAYFLNNSYQNKECSL